MRRLTARPLLLGTLALFGLRLVLSLIRTGPVLVADEMGYLANARVLVGGAAGQLAEAPFYRAGYSLLLAPFAALDSHPTLAYHLILALNAALVASVFPLLYLLLTRFGRVRAGVAVWAAFAGALYPALTVLSQVAMSENALFPLVCLWLLAFGGLWEASSRRGELLWSVAFGTATGGLWLVHNRTIVAVALALAAYAWLAYRRRLRPAAALAGVGVVAVALLGTHLLDNFVIEHNYGGSATDELAQRSDALFRLEGLRTAFANLLGQSWYLLVASFGLAGVAAADLFRRRRPRDGAETTAPAVLAALLALTALLLLISAAAFPERTRPDMLIYGRYAEIAAPPLIAFGFAALAVAPRPSLRSVAWALGGFGALTVVVVLIRATASDPEAANRWNISALPFVTVQLGPAILIGAAIVALGGLALLWRASSSSVRAQGAAAAALFLGVIADGAWNPVRSSQRAVYPPGWESPQAVAGAAGLKSVAYDLDHYDTIGLYVTQWFLPDTSVLLFHGDSQPPPARYVLSSAAWPREHPGGKPRRIWSDRGRDQVLWSLGRPRR